MKEFNRERFLLWLLGGLLAWQCILFFGNGDVPMFRRRMTRRSNALI